MSTKMPSKVKFYRVQTEDCAISVRYDELHTIHVPIVRIQEITYKEYLAERTPKRKYCRKKKRNNNSQLQLWEAV
jgi:hypothetical protein